MARRRRGWHSGHQDFPVPFLNVALQKIALLLHALPAVTLIRPPDVVSINTPRVRVDKYKFAKSKINDGSSKMLPQGYRSPMVWACFRGQGARGKDHNSST